MSRNRSLNCLFRLTVKSPKKHSTASMKEISWADSLSASKSYSKSRGSNRCQSTTLLPQWGSSNAPVLHSVNHRARERTAFNTTVAWLLYEYRKTLSLSTRFEGCGECGFNILVFRFRPSRVFLAPGGEERGRPTPFKFLACLLVSRYADIEAFYSLCIVGLIEAP